ncbi:hypothetical protein ACFQ1M_04045 [Sungkyunkwania multivorans]|uniref:Tetratricopeptide repeat protein n=1 Tax=Sungkyunkwania multivorans TaxID=1173618 RepID=A0ABW3CWC6_9FLAO
MKTRLIATFLLASIFVGCTGGSEKITDRSDYDTYLMVDSSEKTSNLKREVAFWSQKVNRDSIQIISLGKLGDLYTQLFDRTGDIQFLKDAEQVLAKAADVAAIGKDSYRFALARNYVTQHRFKDALALLQQVNEDTGVVSKPLAMQLFDIHLELGNDMAAEEYLGIFKNDYSFDALIRIAKWQDSLGELDAAIFYMESAMKLAKKSKNKSLMLWSYSNLADFYGHAGRLQQSYEYYLKALQLDQDDTYALKGIAWILFSKEGDANEASRILDAISLKKNTPDLQLFKEKIARSLQNEKEVEQQRLAYFTQVTDANYGVMYDSYSIELLVENPTTLEKAISLAKNEVNNRPTPETYGLLAYALFKSGAKQVALQIIEAHVAGKTSEPKTLYHMAAIYKANNKTMEVIPLKDELKASLFELGPIYHEKIDHL